MGPGLLGEGGWVMAPFLELLLSRSIVRMRWEEWRGWEGSEVSWGGEELGGPSSDLPGGASGPELSRLSRSTPLWLWGCLEPSPPSAVDPPQVLSSLAKCLCALDG